MSLNLTGLSVYTDENKMELIKKSILEGRTLEFVTVQADIKSSANINIIDSSLVGQAGACGFTPLGETSLTVRELKVDKVKINESICLDELEAYYTQKMMNSGSYNESIPFEQIYSEDKSDKVADMIESIIWKGDKDSGSGNLALGNGYLKLTDSLTGQTVNGNTGSVSSLTASNIIEVVDGMVESIPADIINADDLILFVGYDTYRLYARALRNANLFAYTGAENQGEDFSQMVPGTNVKVVAVKGLNGTNRMELTRIANKYVGVDMLNDAESFSIFYSQDNDEVRFISKFKIGVQFAFPGFVVDFKLV
jgi:hypothetical protein